MKKENMQNTSKAGSIYQEINEIKKMQKNPEQILSAITNTCSGYYTLFCC